ncbi:UNVERIFIED_CONTAM: hypothetical protein PYX00_002497 [Menopon gallinae]|uniref:Uncharacterized protein n=1 Tax=Menopon gallinae TaxID=328185 RepID=A0AAW2IID6_9NEOP
MSNTGGSNVQNDDEEDIYKDIGDFHFDRELTKLEESNKAYSEDITRLSERLKQLTNENEKLQNLNDILATNISILLKTAKAEIDRKQNIIDDLRKKLDMNYKQLHKTGREPRICQSLTQHPFRENQDFNEIEEGEIVKDDITETSSEEKKFFSYKGRRDHSGNSKKRECSDEDSRAKFKDRHSSSHSHKGSRYSDENRTRHSSLSKSHRAYDSFDRRRDSDRRERREFRRGRKHSPNSDHSSGSYKTGRQSRNKEDSKHHGSRHSHSSTSHRRDNSSEATRRSEKKSVEPCLEVNSESTAISHKSETESAKDIERRDDLKKEKSNGVKKMKIDVYYHKRNSDNQKKSGNELFTRQSVLDDLYDEPKTSSRFSDTQDQIKSPQRGNGSVTNEDWIENQVRNKPEPTKKMKTLYSRRMEAKLQQHINEETFSGPEDKVKTPNNVEKGDIEQEKDSKTESGHDRNKDRTESLEKGDRDQDEKEEGEITFDEDVSEISDNRECVTSHGGASKNEDTAVNLPCKSVDSSQVNKNHQSFGESLIVKLLQLQKAGEDSGIKEFSPLKNNYKLSKISPVKPPPNQHILEYYNLKPSGQQLTNIEPEILDFSLCLPETPGKNFTHPFCIPSEPQNNDKPVISDENSAKEDKTSTNGESESEIGEVSGYGCDKRRTSPGVNSKISLNIYKKNNESDNVRSENESRELGNKKCNEVSENEKSYHLRTRSKTRSDRKKSNSSAEVETDSRRTEESRRKRKPDREEELNTPVKRKRHSPIEYEREKTEKTPKTERREEPVANETIAVDVLRSSIDGTAASEETARPDDSIAVAENTSETVEKTDEMPSAEISGDSSTFKVLRNYLMLSANDDSDADDFSCSSSGEYSDSGASAFVDLL